MNHEELEMRESISFPKKEPLTSNVFIKALGLAFLFHLLGFLIFRVQPFTPNLSSWIFLPVQVQAEFKKDAIARGFDELDPIEEGFFSEIEPPKIQPLTLKNSDFFLRETWQRQEVDLDPVIEYRPFQVSFTGPFEKIKINESSFTLKGKISEIQEWTLKWRVFVENGSLHPFFFIPLHEKVDERIEREGLKILKNLEFIPNAKESILVGEVEMTILEKNHED